MLKPAENIMAANYLSSPYRRTASLVTADSAPSLIFTDTSSEDMAVRTLNGQPPLEAICTHQQSIDGAAELTLLKQDETDRATEREDVNAVMSAALNYLARITDHVGIIITALDII